LFIYKDYTQMYGQQNIKKSLYRLPDVLVGKPAPLTRAEI